MSVGVVFASTGGHKMVRALQSFRRTEPDLPVHIVFDTTSNSWKTNRENPPVEWFEKQSNVRVRRIENTAYINGILNEGMRWMKELGYSHVCLFHDDIIFSSLRVHCGHVSKWFLELESSVELKNASALTFSHMEAVVPKVWSKPPSEWDVMELEGEDFWEMLCPNGKAAGHIKYEEETYEELDFSVFYVQYCVTDKIRKWARLGPTGQIVPVDVWKKIGGFDEYEGIFYDGQYPAECAVKGFAPVLMIPNVPHLHLHNQSIGYADPANGVNLLWSSFTRAFTRRYGKEPKSFWKERDEICTFS